jgi:hypothetical protein
MIFQDHALSNQGMHTLSTPDTSLLRFNQICHCQHQWALLSQAAFFTIPINLHHIRNDAKEGDGILVNHGFAQAFETNGQAGGPPDEGKRAGGVPCRLR